MFLTGGALRIFANTNQHLFAPFAAVVGAFLGFLDFLGFIGFLGFFCPLPIQHT